VVVNMTLSEKIANFEKEIQTHENNNDGSIHWVEEHREMLIEFDNLLETQMFNDMEPIKR
jgi:MinD-like ATPase involved in chromosome partitioning or flagellar assembly